jgi:hypothetical protein
MDMVTFSWRNRVNVYGCGPGGVGYSRDSGLTWLNKNGNLETLFGSIPEFTKVIPLIF